LTMRGISIIVTGGFIIIQINMVIMPLILSGNNSTSCMPTLPSDDTAGTDAWL
jgi:hypothetical protein